MRAVLRLCPEILRSILLDPDRTTPVGKAWERPQGATPCVIIQCYGTRYRLRASIARILLCITILVDYVSQVDAHYVRVVERMFIPTTSPFHHLRHTRTQNQHFAPFIVLVHIFITLGHLLLMVPIACQQGQRNSSTSPTMSSASG